MDIHTVSAIRTVYDPVIVIDALWHAYQDEIGGPCPIALLEHLTAQWALETAQGRAMWNNNIGNMRGHGPDGATMSIHGADEIIDGKRVIVEGGFAAYATLTEGARAFVRYLGVATRPPAPNRYQHAWEASSNNDTETYVHELRIHGYFTASESKYLAAMKSELAWVRSGPIPAFLEFINGTPPTR